ncbi:hypothetical protein DNTS_013326 [Danionella cerebrum]|uniref:Uncharacterized protein n=1 Tax=Danionella cerebrum TaxID=2873325 RepID=A0A553QG80_9TELE|nr:hypothetical protein DNTS_013326 [Danionella translucida]
MSTVKILAGSTVEIAAASVADNHVLSAMRLTEEKKSSEIFNGLKIVEDLELEDAEVEEVATENSDPKTEEDEELQALPTVEETLFVEQINSEADSILVDDTDFEMPASSEEGTGIELEITLESESLEVRLTEDDTASDAEEVTKDMTEELSEKIEEEITLIQYPETEPPRCLEEALQPLTDAAESGEVDQILDAEATEAAGASEEVVESEHATASKA